MSKYLDGKHWVLFLGLTIGLATSAAQAAEKKLDLAAEAKQAAQEEADQRADIEKGIKGTRQRQFFGTFVALTEQNDKISPEVVGSFLTSNLDKKPGRSYLVKVENGSKVILAALNRVNGKKAQLAGNLRVIDENGEAKYLVVGQVIEQSATRPVSERRKGGGI